MHSFLVASKKHIYIYICMFIIISMSTIIIIIILFYFILYYFCIVLFSLRKMIGSAKSATILNLKSATRFACL